MKLMRITFYALFSKPSPIYLLKYPLTLFMALLFILFFLSLPRSLRRHFDANRTDAPRCKPGTEQTSMGAINMHSIDVSCEVEADPADGVRFSWTYNNTRNVSPVCLFIFMQAQCVCVYTIYRTFYE